MAMQVLQDIRDREWDMYSRQLDAWRTQQLIEADRRREEENAKRLNRLLIEAKTEAIEAKTEAIEAKAKAAHAQTETAEAKAKANYAQAEAAEAKAKASDAEARALAAETALATLRGQAPKS